jgi:hypothetical protein
MAIVMQQEKSWTFIMRIQGRFKQLPDGVLYMGAELPRSIELGTGLIREMSVTRWAADVTMSA